MSYRLNLPTADESAVLLTVEDWKRVMGREVGTASGRPVVAVDLGAGRAWSAAVAIWQSGRMEAVAVAPGVPSITAQEKRDLVKGGVYRKLVDSGALRVAEGLRVQPPGQLVDMIVSRWGRPASIVCAASVSPNWRTVRGESRLPPSLPLVRGVRGYRALRKIAKDGPLSCSGPSAALVTASLAVSLVKNDESGNVRLVKRGTNNTARDDVAAALILAAGSFVRASGHRRPRWRYRGAA